ncbi:MAG: hypothetical protein IJX65_02990 [Alistipes sp.]|nr:hypothetical protein [Alistipes sp.]
MSDKNMQQGVKMVYKQGLYILLVLFVLLCLMAIIGWRTTETDSKIIIVGIIVAMIPVMTFMHYKITKEDVVPKRLTREAVIDIIKAKGYSIEEDRGGWICIKVDGIFYRLSYFAGRLQLGCEWTGDDKNIELLEKAAQHCSNSATMAKFSVTEIENGGYRLDMRISVLCHYEIELQELFNEYMNDLGLAVLNFWDAYNDFEQQYNMTQNFCVPEYRWLSDLLKAVKEGELPMEALTDEAYISQSFARAMTNRTLAQLWAEAFRIIRVDNYGDYKLIVYQFPAPQVVPEAKYGAVVLNRTTKESNYYTLEMAADNRWFYGGVADNRHINHGEAPSDSLDQFIEWVISNNEQIFASSSNNRTSTES